MYHYQAFKLIQEFIKFSSNTKFNFVILFKYHLLL